MLFRFRRRKPATPIPPSCLVPGIVRARRAKPSSVLFATADQTRVGNQTPASRWRANGGRW
ncbi:hypothetical protein GA0074696_3806 [Micromonospora purpureochromogenes]|uniref:Uncharacterized protein n=1 Tax=Micromonospora purpureochromogenes TaxID=47872 RepID=A0A1C4YX41_9ACTN|nr:hypothetical protein GA0074696_3806 [Micromonospora purpureochromogenes]